MDKIKVLITGVSGFIGIPLAEKLLTQKCEILALSRTTPTIKSNDSIVWLEADLSSPNSYREQIESFSPDVVIHLAWQDIPDFSFQTSIKNLNQSLEFLSFVSGLKSCKKILVSGSCWEFNIKKGECLETDVSIPKDHFTWAKHSIRTWLEMICKQNEISLGWFRIFYVYGPRQRAASLIPTVLNDVKNGKIPQIKTPKNANDYIFVDDVIDAFAIATNNNFSSGIYNLGSGKSTSVLDICRCAERIVRGSDTLTLQLENESKLNIADIDFWAGNNITKEALNWMPETTLEDGIRKTWNYINTLC
ncbi:MAG: NAD-dependent epimerase/dehydratase family protein [Gammaproteobacteria bacterium]|nr:NAD-dependent epimerase/dehydratase family protein [Gammaproteobacteria bacterium]